MQNGLTNLDGFFVVIFQSFFYQEFDYHLVSLQKIMELFPSDYVPDCPMYKNQLQEFAQNSGMPLPVYHNVNEGFAHAPMFRATVMVGRTKYVSKLTFPDLRAAEQDVAKLAYESIKNIKPELGPFLIHQEPIFCKSILHEYAIKMNLGIPKYQTTYVEGSRLVFISSFDLGGKTYTGEVAQSKKVAEQLVALVAIRSLLVSDSGTLTRVIKSKEKLYATLYAKMKSRNDGTSGVLLQKPGVLRGQQASIQTEIINYSGHGAVTNPGIGIKRKLEFNNRMQKKNQSNARVVYKGA